MFGGLRACSRWHPLLLGPGRDRAHYPAVRATSPPGLSELPRGSTMPPDDGTEFPMSIVMVTGKCLALITIRSVDPDLSARMGHFIAEHLTTANVGGVRDLCCADCAMRSRPMCNTMSTALASGTRPAISDWRAIPTLMSNAHPRRGPAHRRQHRQAAGLAAAKGRQTAPCAPV